MKRGNADIEDTPHAIVIILATISIHLLQEWNPMHLNSKLIFEKYVRSYFKVNSNWTCLWYDHDCNEM